MEEGGESGGKMEKEMQIQKNPSRSQSLQTEGEKKKNGMKKALVKMSPRLYLC